MVGLALPADAAWPLVGREAELARIAEDREHGVCGVVITAPAGVGKSRLGQEALAAAERSGVRWSCLPLANRFGCQRWRG